MAKEQEGYQSWVNTQEVCKDPLSDPILHLCNWPITLASSKQKMEAYVGQVVSRFEPQTQLMAGRQVLKQAG